MINDTIMLWVTIVALFVSVGFLAYRAERRRGYKPFWTGLAASLIIVTGKFIFEIPWFFYSGVVLLIAASLWNSWPGKKLAGATLNITPQVEEEK